MGVRHNLHIKLLCLFVALLLWVQVAGTVDVVKEVELPITIVGLADSLVVRSASLPSKARVRIRGSKLQLLLRDWFEREAGTAELYLADATAGLMRYELAPDDIRVSAIPEEVLSPQDVRFRVHRKIEREVPVRVALVGQLQKEHTLSGLPEVTPSTVSIKGPEPLIRALNQINTESLQLNGRRQSFRELVRLAVPDQDVELRPVEVQVSIGVDQMVERAFRDVPLTILSDIDPAWVHVDPMTAQVRLKGASNLVGSFQPEDVSVLVHIAELLPGIYELPAEVVLPDGATVTAIDPRVVRVVVERPSAPNSQR